MQTSLPSEWEEVGIPKQYLMLRRELPTGEQQKLLTGAASLNSHTTQEIGCPGQERASIYF